MTNPVRGLFANTQSRRECFLAGQVYLKYDPRLNNLPFTLTLNTRLFLALLTYLIRPKVVQREGWPLL